MGTFIAWDCVSPEERNKLLLACRTKRVSTFGGCGEVTVRLRLTSGLEKTSMQMS